MYRDRHYTYHTSLCSLHTFLLKLLEKLLEKTNWYKQKPKEEKREEARKRSSGKVTPSPEESTAVSVMFCPQTPHGELARRRRHRSEWFIHWIENRHKQYMWDVPWMWFGRSTLAAGKCRGGWRPASLHTSPWPSSWTSSVVAVFSDVSLKR